jgi:uncharacterized protein YggT (Ycf19 family)
MIDNKLLQEESQRINNYEAVVDNSVSENHRINNIAGNMRHKAIDEVVETQNEIERGRILARISQIVDYFFYVVYALLTIRLVLALFAARPSAGFVQFIYTITDPIYAPFKGIVPSPSVEGGFTLALPIIIALIVYLVVHLGINGLLRIFVHRKTEI